MGVTNRVTWAAAASFLGAIAIPIVLTFGPLAIKDSLLLVTTISSVELIYLSAILSTVLYLQKSVEGKLKGLVPIEFISESDWYVRFSEALRRARTRVRLSYMSNKSPLDSKNEETRNYYSKLGSVIKSNPRVDFRRLVRAVPGLGKWIEAMVEEMENVANFSLACLPDDEPDVDEIPTVSVQCIDYDDVYFVAVGEQQESRGPRDFYVQSDEVNRIWTQYYERLWKKAIVVVNRGRIDDAALGRVRIMLRGKGSDT